MAGSADAQQAPVSTTSMAKIVGASLIGTTIEWYDFFLFGSAAALVFDSLFFPEFDPLIGTLASFGTAAVGFAARPLGGIVFGHYGDKVGRKSMLVLSLLMMGVSTFLMGVLPTYAQVGVLAPILLVGLRLIQGFALGGEWGGAVLMVAEHGDPRRRGYFSSWPQAGVPMGNLLAVAVLAVLSATLSDAAFESWGWRVPFMISAALVLIGLWIRTSISESPVFKQAQEQAERKREGAPPKPPFFEVLRDYRREVAIAMGARFAENVSYYIFTVFVLTYTTTQLGLPRGTALNAVLIASLVHLVAIPLMGALSDNFGRRPLYILGAVGMGAWAFVFFGLLDTRSPSLILLAIAVGLIFHAAMYGPQAAFFSELFGTSVRYSGASIGYQLSSVFAGALAPIIAVALLDRFGGSLPIALYMAASAVLTVVAVVLSKETSKSDLGADRTPAAAAARNRARTG